MELNNTFTAEEEMMFLIDEDIIDVVRQSIDEELEADKSELVTVEEEPIMEAEELTEEINEVTPDLSDTIENEEKHLPPEILQEIFIEGIQNSEKGEVTINVIDEEGKSQTITGITDERINELKKDAKNIEASKDKSSLAVHAYLDGKEVSLKKALKFIEKNHIEFEKALEEKFPELVEKARVGLEAREELHNLGIETNELVVDAVINEQRHNKITEKIPENWKKPESKTVNIPNPENEKEALYLLKRFENNELSDIKLNVLDANKENHEISINKNHDEHNKEVFEYSIDEKKVSKDEIVSLLGEYTQNLDVLRQTLDHEEDLHKKDPDISQEKEGDAIYEALEKIEKGAQNKTTISLFDKDNKQHEIKISKWKDRKTGEDRTSLKFDGSKVLKAYLVDFIENSGMKELNTSIIESVSKSYDVQIPNFNDRGAR